MSGKTNGGRTTPGAGLSFFLARYASHRPDLATIKAEADAAIIEYQQRKENPVRAAYTDEDGELLPGYTRGPEGEIIDPDGFTLVTGKGGKYGRTAGGEAGVGVVRKRARVEEEEERPKKKKELVDFYRFQLREKKRENLANLRKQFEADKAKVEQLKKARKFKPY